VMKPLSETTQAARRNVLDNEWCKVGFCGRDKVKVSFGKSIGLPIKSFNSKGYQTCVVQFGKSKYQLPDLSLPSEGSSEVS